MRFSYAMLLGLALSISSVSAQALRYSISQSKGADTFGAKSTGQTFTPNVGIAPAPGAPATLPLELVTLHHGNYSPSAPSATTYLNIYDGDPNTTGKFVGSSANSIDTRKLKFRDPMVWQFDKLQLQYTSKYWAVMSSTKTAGGLDVAVSLETEPRAGNSYSGGAGLIANIVEHKSGVDAKFTIDFFTGVQGIFSTSGISCSSSTTTPALRAPLRPQVGRNFVLEHDNLSTGALVLSILGSSDKTWGPVPLPFPIASILPGAPGKCLLQVSVDVLTPVVSTGPTLSLPWTFPSSTSLFGLVLFAQGGQYDTNGKWSWTSKGRIFVGQ